MMVRIMSESHVPARVDAEGFSIRNIATVLYRRRLMILAIAVPLIVIGGLNLFGQAGSYTASARVVVELVRVDLPKWNPNSRNVDYDRELNTFTQSAMTLPVARVAATALQDSIPVMMALDETLIGLDEPGALAGYLLGGLDVNVVGESAIMEFRFTSVAPRISLMAVGALRTAFLEFQVYGRKNERAVEYYEEQMVVVRASVDSLLEIRGTVLRESGYSSLTDELRYESGRLADIEGKLLETEVARQAVEMEYGRLVTYLDGDPREFPMGPDENRSSTLVYWVNTVARHDDEMNSILSLYNEDSGPARRQQALIDESVQKLAAEEHNYVRAIKLALDSLKAQEETLKGQIAGTRARNSRGTIVYRKVSLIDAELKSLNRLLDSLQGKVGEVRLAQFADERVSNTMMLSDPAIISVLTGGTTIVYFIALMVIALALGIISGFVAENLDAWLS